MLYKGCDFLLSIPKTIFFNFYHLPLNQAIRLPFLVHRSVELASLKGKIVLFKDATLFGCVRLGFRLAGTYPISHKSVLENRGTIIFQGKAIIAGGFGISTYRSANLTIGENFAANSSMKLICTTNIKVGKHVRFAWENIIADSDFHELIDEVSNTTTVCSEEVVIGDNNWFGMRSIILKGTRTPNYCITGANSLVRSDFINYGEKILIAGNPAKFVRDKIYREISKEYRCI